MSKKNKKNKKNKRKSWPLPISFCKDNDIKDFPLRKKYNVSKYLKNREYWNILEDKDFYFCAEREFVKIDIKQMFNIKNFRIFGNPYSNYGNLKNFFEVQFSTMFYYYYFFSLYCLFFKHDQNMIPIALRTPSYYDLVTWFFITFFLVSIFFGFFYFDGLDIRRGIKINVDLSTIYCSRIDFKNKEDIVINKKITFGDYAVSKEYKKNEIWGVFIKNPKVKTEQAVCLGISRSEADYLAEKINKVIASESKLED